MVRAPTRRHFNFALHHVFNRKERFDSVILVEDDLDVAPDFFEFMVQCLRA